MNAISSNCCRLSADTAAKLPVNANLIRNSVPFNAEADSLNCAILAPEVTPICPLTDLAHHGSAVAHRIYDKNFLLRPEVARLQSP